MTRPEPTPDAIKEIVVTSLNLHGVAPQEIGDDEPLFGGRLGLDSVDALELVLHLEKRFGVKLDPSGIDPKAFESAASLASLVARLRDEGAGGRAGA